MKARKIIEELKSKQNQEMLMVLAEEQEQDEEREVKNEAITQEQMERMEKIHGIQRAKAQHRINTLSK